ncbi:urease accessory protein UreE [Celeribacter baekdonensis]|nr:urease accessory protein UreE [Celeribacter baekdonensis]
MSAMKAFDVLPGGGVGATNAVSDTVALTYDQRLLRRKKLMTAAGDTIFLDLPQTISLQAGDGIRLEDGRIIGVVAAEEALLAITGDTVTRYAWHIGNRHTPCEIAPDRLVIQRDPVLKAMLEQLGAEVHDIIAPFSPEGGAYGHGRTMGHEHGDHQHMGHEHGDHSHDHSHTHDHDHHHAHAHDHSQDHPHD